MRTTRLLHVQAHSRKIRQAVDGGDGIVARGAVGLRVHRRTGPPLLRRVAGEGPRAALSRWGGAGVP